jgi:outer membrane protein assembly factor BamB
MTTATPIETPTSAPPTCPRCGTEVKEGTRRCGYCLIDLRSRRASAVRRPRVRSSGRVWNGRDWSTLDARSRLIDGAQRVVMVLVVGWFLYGQFFADPEQIPAAGAPSITVAASPNDWPIVDGDLGASRSTSANSHIGGEVAWTRDLESPFSVPMIADETALYAALSDGRLVALEADSGAERWTEQLEFELRFAPPTLAGNRLYVLKRDGRVAALSAATGDTMWESEVDASYAAAPAVADGVVYSYYGFEEADRSYTAPIIGIDASTGEELWRQRVSTVYPLIPPVADSEHLAIAASARVLIFDRATGDQTYWFPFARLGRPVSMSLVDGTVYTASRRLVVAVDTDTIEPWHYSIRRGWLQFWAWGLAPRPPAPEMEWVASAPPTDPLPMVVLSDRVVIAGAGGGVRAYSRATGETLWDAEFGPLSGPPVGAADGIVLVQDGRLLLVDPEDGGELARMDLPVDGARGAIVTAHGTYVSIESGSVLAIR